MINIDEREHNLMKINTAGETLKILIGLPDLIKNKDVVINLALEKIKEGLESL